MKMSHLSACRAHDTCIRTEPGTSRGVPADSRRTMFNVGIKSGPHQATTFLKLRLYSSTQDLPYGNFTVYGKRNKITWINIYILFSSRCLTGDYLTEEDLWGLVTATHVTSLLTGLPECGACLPDSISTGPDPPHLTLSCTCLNTTNKILICYVIKAVDKNLDLKITIYF